MSNNRPNNQFLWKFKTLLNIQNPVEKFDKAFREKANKKIKKMDSYDRKWQNDASKSNDNHFSIMSALFEE